MHMRCSLAMGRVTVYIMVATGKEGRKVCMREKSVILSASGYG